VVPRLACAPVAARRVVVAAAEDGTGRASRERNVSWRDPDDTYEVVIRFGRPFDLQGDGGRFLAGVRVITVPFADRESAEAAQREITVHVRPVHDAGGEDYRQVVAGEVIRAAAEIESGEVPG